MLRSAMLILVCSVLLGTAAADQIVLRDGRVVNDCRIVEKDQALFVEFPHGRLRLVMSQVKDIFRDEDTAYRPKTDYEREQLARGFVHFEGAWRTRRKRDAILAERKAKREAELKKLLSHMEWENAWHEETAHFRIRTNTSEELLRHYAEVFEKFYTSFGKVWSLGRTWGVGPGRSKKSEKPFIKIFRNVDEYVASGAPARSAGLFDPMKEVLTLYHDASDPRFTLNVLFHEGTHLMVHLRRPRFICPLWVNEGLAEYFGSSRILEKGDIVTGEPQDGRLAALRHALAEEAYIPLEQVLLTAPAQFGSIHYAEAWCLVHFLMEHDQYRSRFEGFFTTLMTGAGTDETVISLPKGRSVATLSPENTLALFKKKMGLANLEDLEHELLEYIYYGLPEVGARGYVESARIRIRDRDFEGTLDDIRTALDLGSRDPTCYLYGGRIHALSGAYEKAAVCYMRAMERDPLNPDFHHEAGLALRASEDPAMMREGLRHIHLAHEIAPGEPRFARALEDALAGEDLKLLRGIKARHRREEKKAREAKEKFPDGRIGTATSGFGTGKNGTVKNGIGKSGGGP